MVLLLPVSCCLYLLPLIFIQVRKKYILLNGLLQSLHSFVVFVDDLDKHQDFLHVLVVHGALMSHDDMNSITEHVTVANFHLCQVITAAHPHAAVCN